MIEYPIAPCGTGLFYYAGHGVQMKGRNYLIPVEADIQEADEVGYKAVDADLVLAKMESAGNGTNIVILDACRNNPWPGADRAVGDRGLAVVGVQPAGSYIIYATQPNATAKDGADRNGVFTKHLLATMRTPGLDIDLMVRRVRDAVRAETGGAQVPWSNSSLSSAGFMFAPGKSAPSAVVQPSTPATAPTLTVTRSYGSLIITAASAGSLYLDGAVMGELPAGAEARLDSVEVGERSIELRYATGDKETKTAMVMKGQASVVGFSWRKAASPAPAATTSSSQKAYRIGDTGPAGGLIFYDKGSVSDGWRYLEAAPSDQSASIQWRNGSYRDIKTGTAVGTGKANTEAIIAAQGSGNYAASLCKNLSINGFSDWFLPSKDELNLMYTNLKKKALGGLGEGLLWSSSQDGNYTAWQQSFSDGYQGGNNKNTGYSVRAVRAF